MKCCVHNYLSWLPISFSSGLHESDKDIRYNINLHRGELLIMQVKISKTKISIIRINGSNDIAKSKSWKLSKLNCRCSNIIITKHVKVIHITYP